MLHRLQKESFCYFARECNPSNGLVRDKTERGTPSSIAVTGFSLAVYIVAVERGFMSRGEALKRTLAAVRLCPLASPKSMRTMRWPSGVIIKFAGLMSRWTSP